MKVQEHGVHLEVPGRALIAQASERIKWHRQMADTMRRELKGTLPRGDSEGVGADWKEQARRTDLEVRISDHLEYARFLSFVKESIVRTRRYRLALSDLTVLEIKPRLPYR